MMGRSLHSPSAGNQSDPVGRSAPSVSARRRRPRSMPPFAARQRSARASSAAPAMVRPAPVVGGGGLRRTGRRPTARCPGKQARPALTGRRTCHGRQRQFDDDAQTVAADEHCISRPRGGRRDAGLVGEHCVNVAPTSRREQRTGWYSATRGRVRRRGCCAGSACAPNTQRGPTRSPEPVDIRQAVTEQTSAGFDQVGRRSGSPTVPSARSRPRETRAGPTSGREHRPADRPEIAATWSTRRRPLWTRSPRVRASLGTVR